MPRYKLILEYDGGGFVGWQRQPNGPSVQEALEAAFPKFCGHAVDVAAAGRTDAGVHALGQVAHVDLERDWDPLKIRDALNWHLQPAGVAAIDVAEVPPDFHARFSAVKRAYLYRISDRRARPVLEAGRVWHVPHRLDAEAMHVAAQVLVGHHDFTSFRATECQAKSPEKTLDRLDVRRVGDEIEITTEARSFLHHQVRNMAGTLKMVGEGKWSAQDVADALAARDRSAAGPTAPAEGLYLVRVGY
ncbi:MAG: tRNA pseudouridine(38-40) synthase TruA [Alphaproteobacteria bacterium]|nr:tRNA pseudouridine(38-40) synthase TruA [Alphaproteobacteria bacterium]